MRAALSGASISVVSEPRAVATGSYTQLGINSYFVSYCLIRSLPLAVLTRFPATLTFNYTRPYLRGCCGTHGCAHQLSRSEALAILSRINKSLHQLSFEEVTVELIQLRQPEVIAGKVRVGRCIRVSSQITVVLHQHKRSVERLLLQHPVLRYLHHNIRSQFPTQRIGRKRCY